LLPERQALLLKDVLRHGDEAVAFLEGVSLAAFRKDRRLQLAVERLVEIVGEAAGRVDDATRAAVPVDWKGLRSLRNVLAHRYNEVDHELLYQIVKRRLPGDLKALRPHVDSAHAQDPAPHPPRPRPHAAREAAGPAGHP
jgi:uncharacterized protein with HEPN domain